MNVLGALLQTGLNKMGDSMDNAPDKRIIYSGIAEQRFDTHQNPFFPDGSDRDSWHSGPMTHLLPRGQTSLQDINVHERYVVDRIKEGGIFYLLVKVVNNKGGR